MKNLIIVFVVCMTASVSFATSAADQLDFCAMAIERATDPGLRIQITSIGNNRISVKEGNQINRIYSLTDDKVWTIDGNSFCNLDQAKSGRSGSQILAESLKTLLVDYPNNGSKEANEECSKVKNSGIAAVIKSHFKKYEVEDPTIKSNTSH